MSARSAAHATFTIERRYDASPARVFAAWASAEAKKRWMVCDDSWVQGRHELDFRVGGREANRSGPTDGPVHAFDALYHDIVADVRIVFSYTLRLGERLISVSLATVELESEGTGTRLVLTEQGVFLDGYDGVEEREEGTREGLARLDAVLRAKGVEAAQAR